MGQHQRRTGFALEARPLERRTVEVEAFGEMAVGGDDHADRAEACLVEFGDGSDLDIARSLERGDGREVPQDQLVRAAVHARASFVSTPSTASTTSLTSSMMSS